MSSTTFDTRPELPDGAPPPPDPPAVDGDPRWPTWAGLIAVPAALVVALVGGLLVSVIGALAGDDINDPGPGTTLGMTFAQDIGFVGVALGLAVMAGRALPGDFGLRMPRFWPAVGWSALAYVTLGIVGFLAAAAFGATDEEQDNILETLGIDNGTAYVYVAAFVVCVLAPLAEEFLFRGFVFQALLRLGVVLAAVISGAIFGAIHITNYVGGDTSFGLAAASIVTLTTFGIFLGLLRWKTGSLLPCIVLHAINNSIAFGVMQKWDWQIPVLMAASLALCFAAVALAKRFWRPRLGGPLVERRSNLA